MPATIDTSTIDLTNPLPEAFGKEISSGHSRVDFGTRTDESYFTGRTTYVAPTTKPFKMKRPLCFQDVMVNLATHAQGSMRHVLAAALIDLECMSREGSRTGSLEERKRTEKRTRFDLTVDLTVVDRKLGWP